MTGSNSARMMRVALGAALFAASCLGSTVFATPDPQNWRAADELATEWQLRMTKAVTMRPEGGNFPGGKIDFSKAEPLNYSKGDIVFTGKVLGKSDGKVVFEFSDAPADWNKGDGAFEFNAGENLIQVTGFPENEQSDVFVRIPRDALNNRWPNGVAVGEFQIMRFHEQSREIASFSAPPWALLAPCSAFARFAGALIPAPSSICRGPSTSWTGQTASPTALCFSSSRDSALSQIQTGA